MTTAAYAPLSVYITTPRIISGDMTPYYICNYYTIHYIIYYYSTVWTIGRLTHWEGTETCSSDNPLPCVNAAPSGPPEGLQILSRGITTTPFSQKTVAIEANFKDLNQVAQFWRTVVGGFWPNVEHSIKKCVNSKRALSVGSTLSNWGLQ